MSSHEPEAPDPSDLPYLFGDLLALARVRWVAQMVEGLAALGYPDYAQSDALLMRLLRRQGSAPLNVIGSRLGVTRQAARKVVNRLEARGYASEGRDPRDSRVVKVTLTPAGERYAAAVVEVIRRLNRELAERVAPDDLAAADRVLRSSLTGSRLRDAADRLVAPPPR